MYDDAILNDNYFEDNDDLSPATEVTLIELITINSIILAKLIVRCIRLICRKHSTIIDYDKMIHNGISEEDANKYITETIKFLNSKGYAAIDESAKVVYFRDLTPSGQKFISGYYDSIGKIDEFSVKKAIDSNRGKLQKILSTGLNIVDALTSFIIMIFNTRIVALIGISELAFVAPVIVWSYIDTVMIVKKFLNHIEYMKNKPEVLESVYEDGYYQALADMGYVINDDEASEDVDIFNEGYFDMDDEAMEGPAREYRHRNNIGKSQTYLQGERQHNIYGTPENGAKPRKTFKNMPDGPEKDYEQGRYKRKIRNYDESIRNFDTLEGRNIMEHNNNKMIKKLRSDGMDANSAVDRVYDARIKQYGRRGY